MNASGKSPSGRRVVVTAGATCLLALAVTPVSAAPLKPKVTAAKKQAKAPPPPVRSGGGGATAGPLSLEWRAGEAMRP